MKIYDCFPFFNELDILDMRLNILNDYVDYFVISESTHTHSNNPKPLYFHDNRDRYSKFLDKIIHVVVSNVPQDDDHWTRERYQRDQITRELKDIKEDDILIVSDADEIVNPNSIEDVIKANKFVKFRQTCFYYYLNVVSNWDWKHAYAIPYGQYVSSSQTLSAFRHAGCNDFIDDGGWHFSYLGNEENIITKLKAFAHQELNIPDNINNVARARKENRAYMDMSKLTSVVDIDEYYPRYILDNINTYREKGYVWEGEGNQFKLSEIVLRNTGRILRVP